MRTSTIFALLAVPSTTGFSVDPQPKSTLATRRDVFFGTAALLTTAVSTSLPAFAASGPSKEELDKIVLGYNQINDLLDNWDEKTTTCRENGGECKRDADAVRKAMGLRYTTDPLFQIEKVFAKVKYMDLDPDALDRFFEAAEDWNSAVTMSNSMAFISQFGEYNPGGGADSVLKYLNESKKQVLLAQSALKTIMECLDLKS